MSFSLFRILGSAVSLYSLLCCIRIILTWVPSLSFSKPVYWLAKICDPFLNIFRRLGLRLGNIDFSPAIALCVLGMVSSMLHGFANTGRFSFGGMLSLCVQLIMSLASTVISFFIIIMAIRLAVLIFNGNRYGSFHYMIESLDNSLSSMVYKMAGIFTKSSSYKISLIIAIVEFVVLEVVVTVFANVLIRLIEQLPF